LGTGIHAVGPRRQRGLPLVSVIGGGDPTDAYGAVAWAKRQPDAVAELVGGKPALCLNGYDLVELVRQVCEAAGHPPEWHGQLDPIGRWLRAGVDPAAMLAVCQRCARGRARSLAYFEIPMMETLQPARQTAFL